VFERPANVLVASFLGSPPMNLIEGVLQGRRLTVEGHELDLPTADGAARREVVVGVRPGEVRLGATGLPATVELVEMLGESVIVDLRFGATPLKARLADKRRLAEGEPVALSFDPASLLLFDRASGERIDP
jgi:ABC-type sugar transport system ATPase subunit